LYSFCCKLTGSRSDAQDLFQDTWVKAIGNLHRCAPDKRFINWLFTICINLYRDKYRKVTRWLKVLKSYLSSEHMETEMENVKSQEAGPAEKALKSQQEAAVRRALASLKDTMRLPLILYYYREFSHAEIAEMLGIPGGTVKSRLAAGRSHIKKMLEVGYNERN
jgi:RNA polymerase sigma-70 factor (ECF subfamily)